METIEKITIEVSISEKIFIEDALNQYAKMLIWKANDSIGETKEEQAKRNFWRQKAHKLREIEKKLK